jgi:iron(III) transport system substrate-binding protein
MPPAWNSLLTAAQSEGRVVVYAPPGAEYRPAIIEAFERAHPGVKVDATFADINEQFSRLSAERTAGRYIADVWVSGTNPTVVTMKEGGMIAPLKPALLLPEVLAESNWLQGRLWWADAAEPYTTLMFQGGVNNIVSYNTAQVNPAEFTSYRDLLRPQWRGKIVATDVRRPGPGGVPSRFMYKHPDLGPEFLRRLFGETEITLSADQRQIVDWLSQGRYALAVFASDREIEAAADPGLPVDVVPADRFKEGAPIGPAYGAVALIERAPHPNAAQLYINWLLSADGQAAWQRAVKGPSLRLDVPKDGLPRRQVPSPGVAYTDGGTEEYARLTPSAIRDLITEALERGGRQSP